MEHAATVLLLQQAGHDLPRPVYQPANECLRRVSRLLQQCGVLRSTAVLLPGMYVCPTACSLLPCRLGRYDAKMSVHRAHSLSIRSITCFSITAFHTDSKCIPHCPLTGTLTCLESRHCWTACSCVPLLMPLIKPCMYAPFSRAKPLACA